MRSLGSDAIGGAGGQPTGWYQTAGLTQVPATFDEANEYPPSCPFESKFDCALVGHKNPPAHTINSPHLRSRLRRLVLHIYVQYSISTLAHRGASSTVWLFDWGSHLAPRAIVNSELSSRLGMALA